MERYNRFRGAYLITYRHEPRLNKGFRDDKNYIDLIRLLYLCCKHGQHKGGKALKILDRMLP